MTLRVLMAVDGKPHTGGLSEHASQIAHHLGKQGVEVEMLWRRRPKNIRLPGGFDTLVFSLAIARHARRRRYDVLHTHSSSGFLAQVLAPARTARVVTCHGDEREVWRLERRLERERIHRIPPWSRVLVPLTRLPLFTKVVADADVLIALHEEEARRFRLERRQPRETVAVIPNGCSPASRASVPRPGNLVFMGEWYWKKGPEELVAAYHLMRREHDGLQLTLLGAERGALRSFPERDRASVIATGWLVRQGVENVLSRTDVLVLPSTFEGMPIAALEAMAWGIPVVGYDLVGVRTCVGEAGTLVPVRRPDLLAEAALELVRDRSQRERLSRAASARAAVFSWQTAASRTLDAYALARSRRKSA